MTALWRSTLSSCNRVERLARRVHEWAGVSFKIDVVQFTCLETAHLLHVRDPVDLRVCDSQLRAFREAMHTLDTCTRTWNYIYYNDGQQRVEGQQQGRKPWE